MPIINISQILIKRGNTAAASAYTGPLGELLYDTGLKTLRLQDGVTVGGNPIIGPVQYTEILSNLSTISNSITTITGFDANMLANINSLLSNPVYGNANVAAYLPAYGGDILVDTLSNSTQIAANVNGNVFYFDGSGNFHIPYNTQYTSGNLMFNGGGSTVWDSADRGLNLDPWNGMVSMVQNDYNVGAWHMSPAPAMGANISNYPDQTFYIYGYTGPYDGFNNVYPNVNSYLSLGANSAGISTTDGVNHYTWTFGNNGSLSTGVNDLILSPTTAAGSNDFLEITNTTAALKSSGVVEIGTNTGNVGYKTWTFGTDGSLTFPDTTVQTTAYTGYGDANVAAYLPTYTGNIVANIYTNNLSFANGLPYVNSGVMASYFKGNSGTQAMNVTTTNTVIVTQVENVAGTDISNDSNTGNITLLPGKTYRLRGTIGSLDNGSLTTSPTFNPSSVQWYDVTNNVPLGDSATVEYLNGFNETSPPIQLNPAEAIYTPSTIANVQLIITGGTQTGPQTVTQHIHHPWVDIQVIGGWSPWTTYSNSNVASYLPTYTGNIQAGNIVSVNNGGNPFNLTVTDGINNNSYQFGTGVLTMPGIWSTPHLTLGVSSPNTTLEAPSGQGIEIIAGGGVAGWTYGTNGSLKFPDSTVQTTAYPGPTATDQLVNGSYTLLLDTNGVVNVPTSFYNTAQVFAPTNTSLFLGTSSKFIQVRGSDAAVIFPDYTVQTTAYPGLTILDLVNANVTAANAQISTTQANIGSFYTWANLNYNTQSNAASLQNQIIGANVNIATLQTQIYSNSNVSSYLTTATINTTGNITGGNVQAAGFYWANGTPFVSSSYGNTQVAAYLVANPQAGTYSNTNVTAYLAGNISTGNITLGHIQFHSLDQSISTDNGSSIAVNSRMNLNGSAAGYGLVVANPASFGSSLTVGTNANAQSFYGSGFYWSANGQSILTGITGTYSNTNVAAYLTTASISTTGNITAGNLTVNGLGVAMPSRSAFRVTGSGNTNSLSTTINGNGYLNGYNWAIDYSQGTGVANIGVGATNSTTAGVFVAPIAGLYQVCLNARNSGNLTNYSQIAVIKNPTTTSNVQIMIEFAANSSMNHTGGSTISQLSAGDTLAVKVLAGTINFDSNDNWSVAFIG